ncbi:SLATT domain-containing protein [Acinetobacter haemolyticus]|uniref:SLATT domain-containing protein n=1 Tax=Acinetobacter haemolyticus TaxID=29430 RepID=UPI0024DEC24A|nr:SLATT domain-containing protein [Acinetobacter haemolyticus]
MEIFLKTLKWLYIHFIKLEPEEVHQQGNVNKVVASMKTTAISRYHASTRLAWQSRIAFLTTTFLSLGLIFILLMQLANVKLNLNENVLSAVQIFMAVAVLVYSVIIGTAKYETRCENLNDCGDKIKALIRELRREAENGKDVDKAVLEDIQQRYADIVSDVENHERCDYALTILRYRD